MRRLMEESPMKTFLAGAALVALVTPALADYYIIQEPAAKRCTIVEERPAPGVGIVIGEGGFGLRVDAENRMRTVEVCHEGTTGGPAIREERRGGGGGARPPKIKGKNFPGAHFSGGKPERETLSRGKRGASGVGAPVCVVL